MRLTDSMTVEQLLAGARTELQDLRHSSNWEPYAASRPGRALAVEHLLGTISDLERECINRGRPAARSVAVNVWSLSRRHALSVTEFGGARVTGGRQAHA